MESVQPGFIIGSYEILSEVARGGMGTIYRAKHVDMDAVVAIKILKQDLIAKPEVVKRFLKEGKLISKLDHPGIIKIYDVGQQGKLYYLIMEFVEGKNLQELVNEKGPLAPKLALDITRQAAAALDHAHQFGIVHRDIKPSNLILSDNRKVYVTDFGIARLLEEESSLTRTGTLIGTPSHMSPEQCRGSTVDIRSDIYSLGATLYTLLSGRPPFQG